MGKPSCSRRAANVFAAHRNPNAIRCGFCNMIVGDRRDPERPIPTVEYQWLIESENHARDCFWIEHRGAITVIA